MAPAIPKGSTVLVTGINGYIASHIADQLLEAGYRVRGTARDVSKVEKLAALWDNKFGTGKFELAIVTDMAPDGAFDEAVKGVSGIAHVASNLSFDPDPHKVIPEVLAGVKSLLKSAAAEPSVKRFVYTSSSAATTLSAPETKKHIDTHTWNEEAIAKAWAPPPYEKERAPAVYAASKTEAEKAVWKFVEEEKPGFVANAILPNCNFGKILVKGMRASTGGFVTALWNGNTAPLKEFPAQWFIDVQDTARLHVAALTHPGVQNERILGFAAPFNNNDILRALRKARPEHKFPEDFEDNTRDIMTIENLRGAELLKEMGRSGWTSFEESIAKNAEDL